MALSERCGKTTTCTPSVEPPILIAVFHNGYQEAHREMPLRAESNLKNGQVLVDALSGREFQVRDGKLNISLQPLTPLVLQKGSSNNKVHN